MNVFDAKNPPDAPPGRYWRRKFSNAGLGLVQGVRGQGSFAVHFAAAAVAASLGWAVALAPIEWCVVCGAIAAVLVAELFNSALEHLAKAVTRQFDPHVKAALDIGSAAVLVAACGAALAGAVVFLPHLQAIIKGLSPSPL